MIQALTERRIDALVIASVDSNGNKKKIIVSTIVENGKDDKTWNGLG